MFNVNMFSASVRDGKAFASEQKIRELKNNIFRLKVLEKNKNEIKPKEIIIKARNNLNITPTAEYGLGREYIEKSH